MGGAGASWNHGNHVLFTGLEVLEGFLFFKEKNILDE